MMYQVAMDQSNGGDPRMIGYVLFGFVFIAFLLYTFFGLGEIYSNIKSLALAIFVRTNVKGAFLTLFGSVLVWIVAIVGVSAFTLFREYFFQVASRFYISAIIYLLLALVILGIQKSIKKKPAVLIWSRLDIILLIIVTFSVGAIGYSPKKKNILLSEKSKQNQEVNRTEKIKTGFGELVITSYKDSGDTGVLGDIRLNGKILKTYSDWMFGFEKMYELGNSTVVVFHTNLQGSSCPAMYEYFQVSSAGLVKKGEFGNCMEISETVYKLKSVEFKVPNCHRIEDSIDYLCDGVESYKVQDVLK